MGFFNDLLKQLKKRVLVSGYLDPYLPPNPKAFRYPSPGSQGKQIEVPPVPSRERLYDTTYFSRDQLKGKSIGDEQDMRPTPVDQLPWHMPQPIWVRNPDNSKFMVDFHAKTGIHLIGRYPNFNRDVNICETLIGMSRSEFPIPQPHPPKKHPLDPPYS